MRRKEFARALARLNMWLHDRQFTISPNQTTRYGYGLQTNKEPIILTEAYCLAPICRANFRQYSG